MQRTLQTNITAPTHWQRVVGIDPGTVTGMIAVLVPESTKRIGDARLIGAKSVTHGGSTEGIGVTPQARSLLFFTVRETLLRWKPDLVVIEEPWDAQPMWGRDSGRTKGASRGTIFTLGSHFGLVLAAAASLPSAPRIASYPVTSHPPKRGRPGVLGWMQRRASRPPKGDVTRDECARLLRGLCARPATGAIADEDKISAYVERVREHEHDVLMALGVLTFHLDRERGAV
jgi:hypothetical protein